MKNNEIEKVEEREKERNNESGSCEEYNKKLYM